MANRATNHPGLHERGYSLSSRLGQGGFAEVYLGELRGSAGFVRPVAVKVLRPGREGDLSKEAMLAGRLRHPNLVEVLDLVEAKGRLHLIMELVDGGDAADLLRQGALSELVVAYIADQVLEGLAAAHAKGMIAHRDVTPHNILFTKEGRVKLADFGIAKDASSEGTTGTGFVKGKVGYLAPEQISGAPVDPRMDLWALGVALVELASGRRLFGGIGQSDGEVIGRIVGAKQAPVPEELSTRLVVLGAFFEGLLQLNLADRFESAATAQTALHEAWGGRPEGRLALQRCLVGGASTRDVRPAKVPSRSRPEARKKPGRLARWRRYGWMCLQAGLLVAFGVGLGFLGASQTPVEQTNQLEGHRVTLAPVQAPEVVRRAKPVRLKRAKKRAGPPLKTQKPLRKARPRESLSGAYFEVGGTLKVEEAE